MKPLPLTLWGYSGPYVERDAEPLAPRRKESSRRPSRAKTTTPARRSRFVPCPAADCEASFVPSYVGQVYCSRGCAYRCRA